MLIDSEKFKESLIECNGLGRKSLEALLKHIDNYATDYDKEKVIIQIQDYMKQAICNDVTYLVDISHDVIEIIEKGGVS